MGMGKELERVRRWLPWADRAVGPPGALSDWKGLAKRLALTLRALLATPGSYERGGIGDLEGLQYATNLEELDVSAERWDSAAERWHNLNDLSDLSPLAGLTKLETLDLSGSNSRITDISPLSGLTGLRRLDLWNARITDLEPLAGMRELEFLDLTSNDRLSDLSPLSGLTKLRDLRLSYNAIGGLGRDFRRVGAGGIRRRGRRGGRPARAGLRRQRALLGRFRAGLDSAHAMK